MNDTINAIRQLLFPAEISTPKGLLNHARSLHQAIPLIAQTLVASTTTRIKVRSVKGFGGKTDGKTIWITNGVLPRDESDLARYLVYLATKVGLLHHEVGHVNESDMSCLKMISTPIEGAVFNIIEDVRMENAHIRRYKVSRKYLDALSLASIELGCNGPVAEDADMPQIVTAYLLYALRYIYRGDRAFQHLSVQLREQLASKIGNGAVIRLEAVLGRTALLKNANDSLDLARDVLFLLKEEEERARQDASPPESSDQDSDAQLSESDSSVSSTDTDAHQPPGDVDQDSGDEGSGDQDSSDPSTSSSGIDDQSDQSDHAEMLSRIFTDACDPDSSNFHEQLKDALDGLTSTLHQDRQYVDATFDQAVISGNEEVLMANVCVEGDSCLDEAVGEVSRLAARLRSKLQAQTIAPGARRSTGSKVRTKYLPQVATGDMRIFCKQSDVTRTDTAVFILGDVSGSMSGECLKVSNQVLFATALALEKIPEIDVAVGAFPGIQLVKAFKQKTRDLKERFNLKCQGCTPLHEGVAMAHSILERSRRSRKILIVCTDGEPDCEVSARASVLCASSRGIEVFGIGIGGMASVDCFDRWAEVSKIRDLPDALFKVLSKSFGVDLAA